MINQSSRVIENFNFRWKFFKGHLDNAHNSNFDDEDWNNIDLPHDWSIEGSFDKKWASGTGYLPGGIGWYRKRFTIPKNDEQKKIFIYFEGIYNNSEVWINETYLGRRPNGYVSFYYDLTPHINFGSKNYIAVRVDHSKYADSRWYTGSGIYRNVKLIKTNRIYIKPWGVYAKANLKDNKGNIELQVKIKNEIAELSSITLINELRYNSKAVGRIENKLIIKLGEELRFTGKIEVEDPKLWDIESPELYKLVSIIKDEQDFLDQVEINIGFRDIQIDSNSGLFLNEKNVKLKGVCMHHDAGCLGAAVPKDVLNRRLNILKEMGCNAIRTSHNAFAPDFYDLCDQKGFLVIDEVFDEWELPKKKWVEGWNIGTPSLDGYAEYFKEWAHIDLRDQILRDRNHPCIFMWSIGNEIDYPNDPYTHEILNTEKNPQSFAKFDPALPHANRLGEIAKDLVRIVKKYDESRPVTAGLASALVSNEVGYAGVLDIVGYNYQEFRYASDHIKYPKRILYGSENSMPLEAWNAVVENEYILGQFLWTGIEYLGEAAKFPIRNSISGLIDLAGHKKPEYYFRMSLWSEEPMVYLGVTKKRKKKRSLWQHHSIEPHWNWNPNQKLQVIIFSNCEEVELFSNGNSLGTKKNSDFPDKELVWDVTFKPGALHAIGRINEQEVASSTIHTAEEPVKLIIKSDRIKLKANKQDVAHIDIEIVDERDIRVSSANNMIKCQITGPIRLLGMEDANYKNTENYKNSQRSAFNGRLLVYIQSLRQVGKAKIKVSSSGLKSAELILNII